MRIVFDLLFLIFNLSSVFNIRMYTDYKNFQEKIFWPNIYTFFLYNLEKLIYLLKYILY